MDISGGSVANTTALPANFQLYSTGSKVTLSAASQTYGVIYALLRHRAQRRHLDFFGEMVGRRSRWDGGGGLQTTTRLLNALMTSQSGAANRPMSKLLLIVTQVVGVAIGAATLYARQIRALSTDSAVTAGGANESAGPILVIDQTERDLGEIRSGKVAEATFLLRNTGDRRLILQKTNGDCDCLSAAETEMFVEPGERRAIVVTLDTSKGSGPARIDLYYRTNDPQRPRLSLFCRANVTQ